MKLNDTTLINFIDLNEDTQLEILTWRNHPTIKKWMYTDDDISFDNHLNFISSLEDDRNKKYFLVEKNEQKIGVIYFTNIDYINKKTDFGIYAKPNSKGFGKILMSTIIDYAFYNLKMDRLIAEVFVENSKAISLYKKFNFREIDIKVVDGRDMIVMELKNENR